MDTRKSGPIMSLEPWGIICDIDGTLALLNGRGPYDAFEYSKDDVNEPIANMLRELKNLYVIFLVTGRAENHREVTEEWLTRYDIPFDYLFMREDKDKRQDTIVKKEIYQEFIEGQYNIEFVLEDRTRVVKMWRSLGLTCLQVADGNF